MMKKVILSMIFILSLLVTGCSSELRAAKIETMQGWSFQYNSGTNDYSVFFGLQDQNGQAVSADVDVDIRIENKQGDTVYTATKSVTPDDFRTYTSKVRGEEYLAEIRIPNSDIAPGKSADGKVYLTVYKDDVLRFDEVNCEAFSCLPVLDVKLETDQLPVEISVRGYDGEIASKILIDNVSYVYDKELTPKLNITVTGTKTHGNSESLYDVVSYKLCDDEGYVIETGELFLDSLSKGDKFKDDSIVIYDIEPGKTYTLTFSESKK